MRRRQVQNSEGKIFAKSITEFRSVSFLTTDKCETFLKENLSGLFVSDVQSFSSSGSESVEDIFEQEDTLHYVFSIDYKANNYIMSSFSNFKRFADKILSRLIRNKNILIDMVVDNPDLLIMLDVIYGFVLSYGKARNVDEFINVGKLRFNIRQENEQCMNLTLLKAVVDKVLLTEVSENLQLEQLKSSYDTSSEFYKSVKQCLDFLNSQAQSSLCLTNSFVNCIVDSEYKNKFTDIFDQISEFDTYSQVIVEIQSSFMYKLERFSLMQIMILKSLIIRNFSEVSEREIYPSIFLDYLSEDLSEIYNMYRKTIQFNLGLFQRVDVCDKIVELINQTESQTCKA